MKEYFFFMGFAFGVICSVVGLVVLSSPYYAV